MTYETNEDNVLRPMTENEIAAYEQWLNEQQKMIDAKEQKEQLKQATLAKLGLTIDEIAALVG